MPAAAACLGCGAAGGQRMAHGMVYAPIQTYVRTCMRTYGMYREYVHTRTEA